MLNKLIIGLTGGIASGKSQVAQILRQKQAKVIDADSVAKSFLTQEKIIVELVETFGTAILDDSKKIINSKLKSLAFSSLENIQKLNKIMWPPTIINIKQEIENSSGVVVLDCALLFESNMDTMVDKVVVVVCDSQTRRQRIINRDGDDRYFDLISKVQSSDQQKISKADIIIFNNGTKQDLYLEIQNMCNGALSDYFN